MKKFTIGFFLILVVAVVTRFYLPWGNNFYFTMDQGNDAVHVREIINRGQLLLLGPVTGIEGLYAGPLWYYFIGLGYWLFGGNPFGAVFMLILLNTLLLGVLMVVVAKLVSRSVGLLVGFLFLFYWPFFDTSRYGFNPFPLLALSFVLVILFASVLEGKKKSFILAALPVGLAFNTEVAFTMAMLLFYFLMALFFLIRKKIAFSTLVYSFLLLGLFFIPHLISEFQTDFSQTQTFLKAFNDETSVFGQRKPLFISQKFLEMASEAAIPQNKFVSLIFIICLLVFFFLNYKKISPEWVKTVVVLVLSFWFVAWVWFALTTGWQIWHTVALSSLLYFALILMMVNLPKIPSLFLIGIVTFSQSLVFGNNYNHFLKLEDDPSLLKNELAAIDWVYRKAEDKGFSVYTYLPSVYDYPSQYLIWWQGINRYGYLPCEYSSFPGAPSLFVPGKKYYQGPSKTCGAQIFLIVEPDKNEINRNVWVAEAQKGSFSVERTTLPGNLVVEKRSQDK